MKGVVRFAICYVLIYFLLVVPVHESGHILMIETFGSNFEVMYKPPFGFAVTSTSNLSWWQKDVVGLAGGFTAGTLLLIARRFVSDTTLNSVLLAHAITNLVYAPFEPILWQNLRPCYWFSAVFGLLVVVCMNKMDKQKIKVI